MDNVYEVVKKEEPRLNSKGRNRPSETSHGLYQYENSAIKYAKEQNDWIIRRLVDEASKLTGTVRGVNADRYQEIMQKILNPPYSVKPRRLNRRY